MQFRNTLFPWFVNATAGLQLSQRLLAEKEETVVAAAARSASVPETTKLCPPGRMLLLLGTGFLLSAAFAPAAAMAHNTFVCLPKPVKFDTCTSIRLLSPCQTDQDCDTRVCCKDWCGNYCAFKQRSFAVAKPPPVEPGPAAIDEDEAEETPAQQPPPPPPQPARGNRGRNADEDEEPPRRNNMRRRYKNRAGRRRRRMDAAGSDGAIMHGPGRDDDDREPSGNGLGGQLEHEYFDVRK
ncbi:uncharacterized protein LOC119466585 [Dermacentor silvarum]|uniref:uncharacterized protein LOC119466585 n=1 Tax=Dermacentor silvarum TaxID=543639 RepID=UPI002101054B|nr:uncharacterized protein LOC119466585 [Dermacentor silvarum]